MKFIFEIVTETVLVSLLSKFERGRSRRSWVIDWKRKGYRRTDQPTDMYKAICPLFFKGGHN